MGALPANVTHGTVTGTLVAAEQLDGSNTDVDSSPISGSVTFTPTPKKVIDASALRVILPKPVVVALDAAGSFTAKLVATDNPSLNPVNWTYKVTFQLTGGLSLDSFDVSVPAGSSQDLSSLVPASASGGVQTIAGPGVASGGTTGQVLAKKSNADFDTQWVPPTRVGIPFGMPGTLVAKAGDGYYYNDTGAPLTIYAVRASVGTAPTGGSVIVDVNRNGVTIFTNPANRPTIAAGTKTATAPAIDVATLAPGDYLTVDVDDVGSTVTGSNLVVTVVLGV